MSDRYWIGSTGNWSDGTHWATSSGGSGGASVPTSSDDVFIDANSGFGSGGTIYSDGSGIICHDFISTTGHNYNLEWAGDDMYIYGSAVFESGISITGDLFIKFMSNDSGETFDPGGVAFDEIVFLGAGSWTLQDDLNISLTYSGYFNQTRGTFDANDFNVTAINFYFDASGYGLTVNMGNGTWEATGNYILWRLIESPQYATINSEGSTIKFTDSTAEYKEFKGHDKTYNNLWISGTGTGVFEITGNNTFNNLKIDAGLTVDFESESTQTVTTFTATGTSGNEIVLDSIDSTNQFTLSKLSGTVECDYLDISNSNATGGATWRAFNSTDSGNNTGWQFPVNTTLTSINAGVASVFDLTITEGSGASTTLSPLALITTLSAMSVVGDANSTLDPVEAGSVTIPEITVGIYQRVFLEALALSTSLYEPTISVERNWGVVNRGHSGWAEQSRSTTTWNQTTSNSTPWQ